MFRCSPTLFGTSNFLEGEKARSFAPGVQVLKSDRQMGEVNTSGVPPSNQEGQLTVLLSVQGRGDSFLHLVERYLQLLRYGGNIDPRPHLLPFIPPDAVSICCRN